MKVAPVGVLAESGDAAPLVGLEPMVLRSPPAAGAPRAVRLHSRNCAVIGARLSAIGEDARQKHPEADARAGYPEELES